VHTPHHIYLTFNPYLNAGDHEAGYTQAHEFHDFLKELIHKNPKSKAHWGKIIALDRVSSLNLVPFQKVLQDNSEAGFSTHLYITDFTNIWVGKVEAVTDHVDKKELKTLDFYAGKNVEVWFELSDFALLEYNSEETAAKLQELFVHNEYNDIEIQGLSPFTTGIKFPLIVQDFADEAYFDELDTDEYSHLILKHNPAVTNTNSLKILHNIHSFAFNEELYAKIPHAAKTEIEAAELDISENRHHNMSRNAFSYIKAFEIILNDLIIHTLKKEGHGDAFYVKVDSPPPKLFLQERPGTVPISQFQKNYSIGQLIYITEKAWNTNHLAFRRAFSKRKPFIQFVTKELKKILEDNCLIEIRNILAHNDAKAIGENDAIAVRNIFLGVGCIGLIHKLYQTFYHKEFDHFVKVQGVYENEGAQLKRKKPKLKLVA